MRKLPAFVVLAAGLGSTTAVAQVPPGVIKGQTTSQVLEQGNFRKLGIYHSNATSTRLRQVSLHRLSTDSPGRWTVCMTVNGVVAKYGNTSLNSSGYVIMGTLDEAKGSFTPNTHAAKLNSPTGGNFGLMIHGRFGRSAVLDRSDGVYFAQRATHLLPFPTPKKISGLTQTYIDPALATLDGKLHLIYVDTYSKSGQSRSRIIAQELDPSGPKVVANTAKIICDTVRSGSGTIIVHSPSPILDAQNRMHGLWLAERLGGDSDMYFKADLNPKHAQQLTVDSGNWLNNGGIGSGRLYFAGGGAIHYSDVAWLCGDSIPVGGKGAIIGAVRDQLAGPNVTALLLSAAPIKGVTIPGVNGKLGVNPATVVVFGALVHNDASERAEQAISIPNDTRFKGIVAWLQGLSIDRAGNNEKNSFTNTTTITIR